MMKKILPMLVLFAYVLFSQQSFAQTAYSQKDGFVSVNHSQFNVDGKPYYYIGANYWYGPLLGLQQDKKRGIERLRKELDFLKEEGVTNLRLLAAAEGTGMISGVQRVEPPLQPAQGIFDQSVLDGLDLILFEMGKRNMKAVIFLSNNWEWSGGFLQYLRWNGLIEDSVFRKKLSWDEQRDYTSKFYSCSQCVESYNKQVRLIVNRTNKYSNKKYKDDNAIMAWELVNEPRPMRPSANEAYKLWISNTAALIKSIDKNHLITLGHEGLMATDNQMELFEQVHANKNVDYLTIHIWPKNWGWFKDTSIAASLNNVINTTNDYIKKHEAIAKKLNKPLVIEEFGLPRDLHSFDINSTTALRDNYYKNIFDYWQKSVQENGIIAGCNFWAFGGLSRPVPGQVFWKKGDDYMGDPPMEEQGLNSVFDSDSSTWQLIESYTKNSVGAYHRAANLPSVEKTTKKH